MKTVLVTGGSGLVGKGIQRALELDPRSDETWIFLRSSDGDLTKYEDTRAIFEKHRPTHVIHLAAKVGGLFNNMRHKVEFFRDNIAMNDNILRCSKELKVEKCISCLSTCIFPDKTTYPIDETMVHNGPPHPSNEGYAYAKRMLDVLNRCYNEEYGTKFLSVIPTNIFGPYDNYNLQDGHVIPGLMHKCLIAQRTGTDFVIWGSGAPLRQFVYSIDLGKLFVWALRHYDDTSEPIIFSVSEEEEVSIKDVALMVAEGMNFKGNITFDTTKADGQFKKTASNQKLKRLYPEFKFTPIREAISDSCKWFIENYDSARK
eukprot:TRINITY_DN4710_c0_g1_i2.p1 TRINITY_DN4710_c0_g1~~TRINITY_DN4710_c0_g1_i2.p1  ORF type:complete len:316 (+),score=75.50 TRINITY_DN4710_c0_g1_i2:66-1013(+)